MLQNLYTYPFVSLSNVASKVVNRNILAAVRAVGLLAQVDALHVVVEQLLGLELLLAVGALVVPDLLVEILHMMVQVFKLLVADVTSGGFG